MNSQEQQLAQKIWPQHMRHKHAIIEAKRKHAREWITSQFGEKHLLATPLPRRG